MNPNSSGTTSKFGEQWESRLLSAAIAHPHKDSTLIVGPGTDRDPGPIVGEIGLVKTERARPYVSSGATVRSLRSKRLSPIKKIYCWPESAWGMRFVFI